MKLWNRNYNEVVSNQTEHWKKYSRLNHYFLCYQNKKRKIKDIVKEYDVKDILDYGCGYAAAMNDFDIPIFRYDPFVEQYSKPPESKYDLTVCYNVLNIVDNDCVDNVIKHIYDNTNKIVIFNIILNGMHFRTPETYEDKFKNLFEIIEKDIISYSDCLSIWGVKREIIEQKYFLYYLLKRKQ